MKLLFNYLPYSMKDSDSVVRSPKKANAKGPASVSSSNTKITKFFSSFYSSNSNSTSTNTSNLNKNGTKERTSKAAGANGKPVGRRGRKKETVENNTATQKSSRPMINGAKRKKSISSSQVSTASSSSSSSTSSNTMTNEKSASNKKSTKKVKKVVKGSSKTSPKLRPRRRASQTYFFKYQLARNPLKAEEEDLKLALLASLQQDDSEISKHHMQQLERQQMIYEHHLQNNICNNNNNKQPRKGVNGNSNNNNNNTTSNTNTQLSNKQQKQKHPPPPNKTTIAQHYKPTPPAYDEEYLGRYRPDTEDFLTFICSRLQKASDYLESTETKHITDELPAPIVTASGSIDQLPHSTNFRPLNGCTPTTTGITVKISNDKTSNEFHNLRRSASPCKSSASNHTASNSSPNHLNSPSNRRRPTRQSPRLASTSRKISEFDSLNQYTAYDSQIMYEEEMNRASMALEDIAQEINGSDDSELGQQGSLKNATGTPMNEMASSETKSLSPYKNNKHLIRGLMTREFAGAFADEEIIFENIKNHKL